ncbi:hypothetical protein FRC08_005313 [Ceratobasidium sp. 394]|nr:hypothetical protein FRC08_005313 [Ceratobasidium sp. 394]KAG9100584.1 hypothetical protein FS749_014337 [Ceratobasidium sp. UAMH 11750]
MSTPITPTPTSGGNPSGGLWSPIGSDKSIYTYSFLGGIGFLTAVVLLFMARSYARRQRFAARVQQAVDEGRLDPAIVNEIMSLPSGALYFGRSKKSRINKVKPSMYEVRLGGRGCKPIGGDDGYNQPKVISVDWKEVMPIAISKFGPPPKQHEPTEQSPQPSPSAAPPSGSIIPNSSGQSCSNIPALPLPTDHPPDAREPSAGAHIVSPTDRLALSVFISMPSPSPPTKNCGDEDPEGMLPDICFGVTEVDVVE